LVDVLSIGWMVGLLVVGWLVGWLVGWFGWTTPPTQYLLNPKSHHEHINHLSIPPNTKHHTIPQTNTRHNSRFHIPHHQHTPPAQLPNLFFGVGGQNPICA